MRRPPGGAEEEGRGNIGQRRPVVLVHEDSRDGSGVRASAASQPFLAAAGIPHSALRSIAPPHDGPDSRPMRVDLRLPPQFSPLSPAPARYVPSHGLMPQTWHALHSKRRVVPAAARVDALYLYRPAHGSREQSPHIERIE